MHTHPALPMDLVSADSVMCESGGGEYPAAISFCFIVLEMPVFPALTKQHACCTKEHDM